MASSPTAQPSPPPPSPSPPASSPRPPSPLPPPPPPPPPSDDRGSSSPSPSPPPPPSDDHGSSSPSPPPPPTTTNDGDTFSHSPPKSLRPKSSKVSHSSNHSSSSSSDDSVTKKSSDHDSKSDTDHGGGTNVIPIAVGVAVGVGLLFLIALLAYLCICRKKKRSPQHEYYLDHAPKGAIPHVGCDYYSPGNPQPRFNNNWQAGSQRCSPVNLPPTPGAMAGGWPSPTPLTPPYGTSTMSSGEMSSNISGRHGPALPPPHPSVALGFSKSSFSYDELALATGGFAQGNLLGQGGFGYVHKGILPDGKEIAVKSLKAGSGQGDREFQAEVEIISRVHHRHLVSLVGYCIAGGQKLLVYEFVPNYTLEHHLHGKGQPVMDWSTRMKIALGSAKGLAYLHEDCHPKIIHRDIKAANILLDYNFEAKVADFGLAKLSSDTNTHVSTRVMGTFGYLAPEYAASGKLTDKSDVFSFGVMLLELITGHRPIDPNSDMDDSLVDWARPLCERALEDGNYSQLVDPLMEGNYDPQEMRRMVACAGSSVRHSARRRPKMSQIVRVLEGDVSVDHMKHGMTSSQSSVFSSSDSESNPYSNKLRKTAPDSTEHSSSEFGQAS